MGVPQNTNKPIIMQSQFERGLYRRQMVSLRGKMASIEFCPTISTYITLFCVTNIVQHVEWQSARGCYISQGEVLVASRLFN